VALMQNSLDRLLAGVAKALHHDVLPQLTDPYAQAQVTAAIEILGNLSTRVTWAADVDVDSLAALASAAASGTEDPELRQAMLDALDAELSRLRSARFGKDDR
jgi:HEAT repeat protein